jgi:hypothetical protein
MIKYKHINTKKLLIMTDEFADDLGGLFCSVESDHLLFATSYLYDLSIFKFIYIHMYNFNIDYQYILCYGLNKLL